MQRFVNKVLTLQPQARRAFFWMLIQNVVLTGILWLVYVSYHAGQHIYFPTP